MTSVVEICNIALSNIRAGSINSLTEPSLPAQQCKLKYEILRDRCLAEIPWQFSRKIAVLASVTEDIFHYAYAYSYPTDCLRINRMVGSYENLPSNSADVISRLRDPEVLALRNRKQQIPYEVFNFNDEKLIGADQPDLRIDYMAKIEDPNLFSNDFIMALSYLLAAELAIPVVGAELGRTLRRDSLTLYSQYMATAMANDSNDQYTEPRESDYITIRS